MPEKKVNKNKKVKLRRAWSRSPVEKAHSTKKGKKGYSRPQEKQSTQKEVDGQVIFWVISKNNMNDENIILNQLLKSRKKIHPGDVFIFQPKNYPFYFGRVIRSDVGNFRESILIYVYNECSDTSDYIPILDLNNLLLHPLIINRLPWSRGYFETIYNRPIDNDEIHQIHCFKKNNGKKVDECGNHLESTEIPLGMYGLWSYRTFNNAVCKKLGIAIKSD